jgi:hypothetical protein
LGAAMMGQARDAGPEVELKPRGMDLGTPDASASPTEPVDADA